jgi:hypothetical protein
MENTEEQIKKPEILEDISHFEITDQGINVKNLEDLRSTIDSQEQTFNNSAESVGGLEIAQETFDKLPTEKQQALMNKIQSLKESFERVEGKFEVASRKRSDGGEEGVLEMGQLVRKARIAYNEWRLKKTR